MAKPNDFTKPVVAVPLGTKIEDAAVETAEPAKAPEAVASPLTVLSGTLPTKAPKAEAKPTARVLQIVGRNMLSKNFRKQLVTEAEVRRLGYSPDACVKAGWAIWAREGVSA